MNGMITAVTAFAAFVITALLGFVVIPLLRKLKYGQTILDIGPKWHKSKEGTPTMGGVMFIIGTFASLAAVICGLALLGRSSEINEGIAEHVGQLRFYAGLLMALAFAAVGFFDDYIKVVKKRNLGLTATQKTVLQLFISAGYLATMALNGLTTTYIPFLGEVDLGLFYWPLALIAIYGFVNAVNLTDGVDGLAGSVTLVAMCCLMLCAASLGMYHINLMAAAVSGALAGFLLWNMHPAKVFMGDTGSMFLGGMVCAAAFGIGRPILLFPVGIIYLAEAFSVIIQVTYYKKTKKRLFKMSPIHHHFEMSGWSENKIVLIFSLITLVFGGIAALLTLYRV